jgi:hypothetical protein
MKLENAIKKLGKYGKVSHNENNQYWVEHNGGILSFYSQDGKIVCINVRGIDDESIPEEDYFAGICCKNLTQAMRIMEEVKKRG